MLKLIPKLWGHEEILVNNEKYCGKYLFVNYGYQVSFHYHKIKDETFYIIEGLVELMVYDNINNTALTYPLRAGEQFRIKPSMVHSFISITPFAKILEVSTNDLVSDSYRYTKSTSIRNMQGKLKRINLLDYIEKGEIK